MSRADEHRIAMLRDLALVDSAILEAGKLRATGDLAEAADALLRSAYYMMGAAGHQASECLKRLAEGAAPCVN